MEPSFLVVPDSFKGTLPSGEAALSIINGFKRVFPNALYHCCPVADGGEGSSEIVGSQLSATRVEEEVYGPYGEKCRAFYYFNSSTNTAYIELAAASGLALVRDLIKQPELATTYGTGELVAAAIRRGAKEVVLFLGGSATTDGFVGLAKALGYRFFDKHNRLIPSVADGKDGNCYTGERLQEIAKIERGSETNMLSGVSVVAIADVTNPLCGKNGSAHIYGPQKGADHSCVLRLDAGLNNLAEIVRRDLDRDFAQLPGAGAAGGAGFGVLSFLDGELKPGAEFFLNLIEFDEKVEHVDLVITGEGKVDSQSMEGKLLKELLNRTKRHNKPLLSLSGVVELERSDFEAHPHFLAFGLGQANALTDSATALTNLSWQVAHALAIRDSLSN